MSKDRYRLVGSRKFDAYDHITSYNKVGYFILWYDGGGWRTRWFDERRQLIDDTIIEETVDVVGWVLNVKCRKKKKPMYDLMKSLEYATSDGTYLMYYEGRSCIISFHYRPEVNEQIFVNVYS